MPNIHLLVLIHGMWGNPGHLSELDRIIRETKSEPNADGVELRVILAKTNQDNSTYDGIDWGGERVAQEVIDEAQTLEESGSKVTHCSVTGYSLGGLVARYVIGILHQKGMFNTVKPMNFNTLATPHIGLPRYDSFFSSLASSLGPKLLSRTGEQFYCVDKWSASGRPLLEVMADPERIFYKALLLFENFTIYANAIHDTTVPYVTAAIELEDIFVEYATNGIEIELDEKYTPIIKSFSLPPYPPAKTPRPGVFTRAWFRRFLPDRPLLPTFFLFPFPLNLVLYASLPILVPIAVSFALIRSVLSARSSRARIKLLEKDASRGQRLIHIMAQLEQDIERAVVNLVEEGVPESSSPALSSTDADTEASLTKPSGKGKSKLNPTPLQPILTPLQRNMIASLNRIPSLKKECAFISGVRNSHAALVCRAVKWVPVHAIGRGVVRHWADHFILSTESERTHTIL